MAAFLQNVQNLALKLFDARAWGWYSRPNFGTFSWTDKNKPGPLAGKVRIHSSPAEQSVPPAKFCLSQGFPSHHVVQITLSRRIRQVQGGRK